MDWWIDFLIASCQGGGGGLWPTLQSATSGNPDDLASLLGASIFI